MRKFPIVRPGLCAGDSRRCFTKCAGGPPVDSGDDRLGTDCVSSVQSRQEQYRASWRRDVIAAWGRDVQALTGSRSRIGTLQRLGTRCPIRSRRPYAHRTRGAYAGGAACKGRQVARSRRHHGKALAGIAGGPDTGKAGLPDQESDTMQGVLAPAGTPEPVIAMLHREIDKVMADPEVAQKMAALGFEKIASTPDEFARRIRADIPKWAKVIQT